MLKQSTVLWCLAKGYLRASACMSTTPRDLARADDPPSPRCEEVLSALCAVNISSPTERFCQDAIEAVFTEAGIDFVREAPLGPQDRPDFLVGTIAVEIKIKGTGANLIRQLGRYARHEEVQEIVLATTLRRILLQAPDSLLGVPIRKHLLQGAY